MVVSHRQDHHPVDLGLEFILVQLLQSRKVFVAFGHVFAIFFRKSAYPGIQFDLMG